MKSWGSQLDWKGKKKSQSKAITKLYTIAKGIFLLIDIANYNVLMSPMLNFYIVGF